MMTELLVVFAWNLSKTFDCNPHDLLITKLDSYGLDRNLLKYINSYLENVCVLIISIALLMI